MTSRRSTKTWLRFAGVAALFAGLFFLIGFFNKYHLPRIESWLLIEIEKLSEAHLPVRLWPTHLKVSFVPPAIILRDVRLKPKTELARNLAPSLIKKIDIRISLMALLRGQVRISSLTLSHADMKFLLKSHPNLWGSGGTFDFALLQQIPVDEIQLENFNVMARVDQANIAFRLENFDLLVENRFKAIYTHIKAPVLELKQPGQTHQLPLNVELKALADNKELQISALKIKSGSSFAVGSARLTGDWMQGQLNTYSLVARTQVDLENTQSWLNVMRPGLSLPALRGEIKLEAQLDAKNVKRPVGAMAIQTRDVMIDGRLIGEVSGKGAWSLTGLLFPSLNIKNSAGHIELSPAEIRLDDGVKVKATTSIHSLEVGQLLRNLKIDAPLRIFAAGQFPCEGELSPKFNIECRGEAISREVWVHEAPPKKSTIVQLESVSAKGQVQVTAKDVSYKADVRLGNKGQGRSEGRIDYDKGFYITYEGLVDLAEVKNLADLKFEGEAKVKGSTSGGAESAGFEMSVTGQNMWLQDFQIGSPQADLKYQKGTLNIHKILGQVGTSRYSGFVSIDLLKEQIFINMRAPYLDLTDIRSAFQRHYLLPIDASGSGSADVQGSGPLQFNRMNYQVKSSFFRGSLAGENFDQLYFNVDAVKGSVAARRVQWLKEQSAIDLTGHISPEGVIDSIARGRALRLEESDAVGRAGLDVTGQLDFTMSIRGQLPKPKLDMRGRLSKMTMGDRDTEDSTFHLAISPEQIAGSADLMGDVVKTEFVWPLIKDIPFRFFAKTDGWDFIPLFTLLSSSARQKNFKSKFTSIVDLRSDKGWYGLNGDLEVNELSIQRGGISLKAQETLFLRFRNGIVNSKNLALEGSGGHLRAQIQNATIDALNTSLHGKVDLSLASLITPFLADLQGRLALSLNVSGKIESPRMAGSLFIEQGYFKFRDFPHPFENVQADLLFSNQDVVINSVKANLASGRLSGDGRIKIIGRKDIPVDIRGTFQDVKLNFPEGVKTQGQGQWSFKGGFFPYTLGIDYQVSAGEVISEFGGQELGESRAITPSSLLPKFITESGNYPLTTDIHILIKEPLSVRNSLAQTPLRGELRIKGPPSSLAFSGTLTPLPGGKIFFRDTPFEIQNGYFEYQDDPPDNPKVYLVAQTEVTENIKDENDRDVINNYEVKFLMQGRLRQPKILLTSLPPLSDKEIVSLLALGMTMGSLESRTAGQVAASNSMQLGAAILQKPLSKETRSRLGFDVQISQANSSTESASSPKFTISKQFTPKLGVSASRTLEKAPQSAVKMEYRVNRNLSLVGSWEGRNEGAAKFEQEASTAQSIFGLDLEYRVNFK